MRNSSFVLLSSLLLMGLATNFYAAFSQVNTPESVNFAETIRTSQGGDPPAPNSDKRRN